LAEILDVDAELVRGVSLPSLLAGRAALFADHGQAARDDPKGTYALSRPVESLSYFVSHSWRTSRLVKYTALCVHFNLRRAAVASAACNFVAFTVSMSAPSALPGWMLMDQMHIADMTYTRGASLCEVVGPLVFVLVLLFGHLVDHSTSFFLDICCISQDDAQLQASGIASLGAVLDRSERMLVLCDGH